MAKPISPSVRLPQELRKSNSCDLSDRTINRGETITTLDIEQLEEGIRLFDRVDYDPAAFWEDNVAAFRQTVLVALSETIDALATKGMRTGRRALLTSQARSLQAFIDLADRYMAARAARSDRPIRSEQQSSHQIN